MDTLHPFEWFYILSALLLLVLSGIFSAAEIALLSVNRFRIHQLSERGSKQANIVQNLLLHPSRPLTVILILITALNYANESLTTHWLTALHQPPLPEWIPFVALLFLILIFAEITPINYAAANPELVAMRTASGIAFMTRVCRPLVAVFTATATAVVRLFGGEPREKPLVTEEEVRTIVDIETERGVLEEEEKELIHSIFEFSDTVVREIMVPRIDIIAASADDQIAHVIDTTIIHRFSRLPVYQGSLDHIVGLAHVKDLLPFALRHETDFPVSQAMHPVMFVPETKRVSELLREFRETKKTLAIVIDEYGGTAGLVTVEDLLEEIVGEIYDEYDIEQKMVEWLDARTLLVDGKVSLDEVSALLHHELPEGEYDTVGGLLYHRFGDVPARGASIVIDGFSFTVARLDGHRIVKVKIVKPESATADRAAGDS